MTLEEAIKHAEEMAKCGGKCGEDHAQLAEWLKELKERRAAELEKRTEERTETHACDCISRRAAIEALDALCDRECEYSKKQRSVMCGACHLGSAFDVVEQLPSAQSEIIRCRDCKHHHRDNSGAYYCGKKDYGYGWGLNDFCSRAERRTDDLQ